MTTVTGAQGQPVPPRRGGRRSFWIRAAITVVLVGFLISLVDLGEIGAILVRARPSLIVAAVAVALADRLLMIGKWYPLLRIQVPTPLVRAGVVYMASSFASIALPASVGGDALRMVALGRQRKATLEVGASIVAERILGMVATALVAPVALLLAAHAGVPLGYLLPWALLAVVIAVAGLIVPLWAAHSRMAKALFKRAGDRAWVRALRKFTNALAAYSEHPGVLVSVGALSVIEQVFPVLVLALASHALSLELSIVAIAVTVPLTSLLDRLPISVAGWGVTEGSFAFLLGLFGAPPEQAVALALAGRVVGMISASPGLVALMFLRFPKAGLDLKPRPSEEPGTTGGAADLDMLRERSPQS